MAQELVNLMNDFLELEKFAAGMAPLDKGSVEIGELLDAAAARATGTCITVRGNRSVCVAVDRDRLEFVVFHVISTIAKYAGIGVPVEIQVEEAGEPWLLMRFSADGARLPAAIEEALFSRFVLLDKGSWSSPGVSVLALPLLRAIVAAHGGTLFSQDGTSGSSICLRLERHRQ